MTNRQTITTAGRTYVLSPDPRLRAGALTQSVVSVQLRDENTGQSPSAGVTAETDFTKLTPKSTVDGMAGLTAIPERAFPQLAVAAYDVSFTVRAPRYLPFSTSVHFAPQPGFPDSFVRADLGTVSLHRESTVLRGRVTRAGVTGLTPVAGATVSIAGYWLEIPPAFAAPPAATPDLVSLLPGVYLSRSSATAQVRRCDFAVTPDVSDLLSDAPAGTAELTLSNRLGLAAGEVLRIDAGDAQRTEHLVVQSVARSSSADQPALVTLEYPGRLDHRSGAAVERVTASPSGPANALLSDAVPGDATVLLTGLAGLAAASAVQIDDGVAPSEYHLVSHFSVITDAGGFYRLPHLNRAGQLELAIDDGVSLVIHRIVIPDYQSVQNSFDFALT